MRRPLRVGLLALAIASAIPCAVAALVARERARRARELFWLEDPSDHGLIVSVAVSPSGKWLVGGDEGGGVSIWSLDDRTFVRHETGANPHRAIWELAFTSDDRLLTSEGGETTSLRRIPGWEAAGTLTRGGSSTRADRFVAATGQRVARTAVDARLGRVAQVWDVRGTPALIATVQASSELALDRTGERLVALDEFRRPAAPLRVFALTAQGQLPAGREVTTVELDSEARLAVSPVADTIAVGMRGDLEPKLEVRLFRFDGTLRKTIVLSSALDDTPAPSRQRDVTRLAFSPDGRWLAATAVCGGAVSGSGLWTFRGWAALWDLERDREAATYDPRVLLGQPAQMPEDSTTISAIAFTASSDRLALTVGRRVYLVPVPE